MSTIDPLAILFEVQLQRINVGFFNNFFNLCSMLNSAGNVSYTIYLIPIHSSGTANIYKWENNKMFKNLFPNG